MKALPVELQTLVVKDLNSYDIVHLQQTCQGFNSFVEGNIEIWKTCLRNLCQLEGLFWSTFNGLLTVDEYKDACTGIERFKRLYRTGGDMFSQSKTRYLPVKEGDASHHLVDDDSFSSKYVAYPTNPGPDVNSMYLVPGGRFLITVADASLSLWDLGPPGRKNAPVALSRHAFLPIPKMDVEILHVDILDDCTALRIVVRESWCDLPPLYDPNLFPSDVNLAFSTYHRFEICLPASEEYTIKVLGRLLVVCKGVVDFVLAAQSGDKVGLQIESGHIFVWDTLESSYGALPFWEAPIAYAIYIQQDHLFKITGALRLDVMDLSRIPLHPIKDGMVVLTSDLQQEAPADYSFKHPTQFKGHGGVLLPASIPSSGAVTFELNVGEKNNKIQRVGFLFRPEEPGSSTFIVPPVGVYPMSSWPKKRFECGNKDWGYIWPEHPGPCVGQLCMSIHQLEHSELPPELTMMNIPKNKLAIFEGVSVCPFSGRIVFLWHRRALEIVDYL